MGDIVRFPIRPARAQGVACLPLDLHFPVVYRTVQTVTQADLDALGERKLQPIEDFIDYSIDPEGLYIGSVVRHPVTHIADRDVPSLVIRHHANLERAHSYLSCLLDITAGDGSDEDVSTIISTGSGLFTLVRRTTNKSWPGPVIIYSAEVMTANGTTDWHLVVGPDGQHWPYERL